MSSRGPLQLPAELELYTFRILYDDTNWLTGHYSTGRQPDKFHCRSRRALVYDLAAVCARWRDLVVSTPYLWTDIVVPDPKQAHHFTLEYIRDVVERSGHVSLNVLLTCDGKRTPASMWDEEDEEINAQHVLYYTTVFKMIFYKASFIQELLFSNSEDLVTRQYGVVEHISCYSFMFFKILELLCLPTPRLEVLVLQMRGVRVRIVDEDGEDCAYFFDNGLPDFLPSAPLLRKIRIDNMPVFLHRGRDILPSMRDLQLVSDSMTANGVWDWLVAVPHLDTMKLELQGQEDDRTTAPEVDIAPFQQLKVLQLYDQQAVRLFRRGGADTPAMMHGPPCMPQLRDLSVDAGPGDQLPREVLAGLQRLSVRGAYSLGLVADYFGPCANLEHLRVQYVFMPNDVTSFTAGLKPDSQGVCLWPRLHTLKIGITTKAWDPSIATVRAVISAIRSRYTHAQKTTEVAAVKHLTLNVPPRVRKQIESEYSGLNVTPVQSTDE